MRYLVLVLMILMVGAAHSMPGKLDSRGCHTSKKEGHHCHDGRAAGGREGVVERERRLKRECRSAANAGACLGYGR